MYVRYWWFATVRRSSMSPFLHSSNTDTCHVGKTAPHWSSSSKSSRRSDTARTRCFVRNKDIFRADRSCSLRSRCRHFRTHRSPLAKASGTNAARSVSVRVKASVCCLAIWTLKFLDTFSMHKSRLNQQAIFLKTDIAEGIPSSSYFSVFALAISISI